MSVSVNYMMSFATAILFTYFFSGLANILSGLDKANSSCEYISEDNITPYLHDCTEKDLKEYKLAEKKKFAIMVAVGIAGIIASFFAKTLHASATIGFAVGGLMSIVYAVFTYWSRIDNNYKTLIAGIALISIVLASMNSDKIMRMYA